MSEHCLKIKDDLAVELNEFWAVDNIDELLVKLMLFAVLFVLQIAIKMGPKSLYLVPYGIELLEIVL